MYKMRLYFEDNNSFKGNVGGFHYLDSFAKTLMWLYTDEADGPRNQKYCLKGVIKMYQLVNVITMLVSHASGELGGASVLDIISDLKKGEGQEWRDSQYNVIREFTNKEGVNGLSIKWATDELIKSILWGGYIYCTATTTIGDNKWKNALDVIYNVMKDELALKDAAFKNHWLIKHTDKMVKSMLDNIEERRKKEMEKEKNASESGLDIQHLSSNKYIEELKSRIKELEEDNRRLAEQHNNPIVATDDENVKKLKEDLEYYKSIYETCHAQVERYEKELGPVEELDDWKEQLTIKERIIFFSAVTDCNLKPNKEKKIKQASQLAKAKLIARFSGGNAQKIRSGINLLNKEIEEVDNKKRNSFNDSTKKAAMNVYNFLHYAVEGVTIGNKSYMCRQAMENIDKTYDLKIKSYNSPPKDDDFLLEQEDTQNTRH